MLSRLEQRLSSAGLMVRGCAPLSSAGKTGGGPSARTAVLIGHVGSSIWPHFSQWLAAQDPVPADPLDCWSKGIIGAAADEFGGRAVFPSDKPYRPFQQWATQAEGLKLSPLGLLIHPVFGLWHAYRGAILFDDVTLSQQVERLSHPCDACVERPCLSACPVSAFSEASYDVTGCRSHLATAEGRVCIGRGCLARRACPVGQEYAYVPDQMRFHMEAFA